MRYPGGMSRALALCLGALVACEPVRDVHKFWRVLPAGLQVLRGDFFFEFPTDWHDCLLEPRPECACGC